MDDEKLCRRCGRILNLSAFNKSKEYGTQSRCRECQTKYRTEYRQDETNTEKERIVGEQYRRENHECLKKRGREYYHSHKEERAIKRLEHYKNNPVYYWAYDTRRGHERRGYKMEISIKDLIVMGKAAKTCPICGVVYDWRGSGRKSENKPSLDRIDNGKTITKESVWVICQRCNAAKGDKPMKKFIEYCRQVVSKFGNTDIEKEVKA